MNDQARLVERLLLPHKKFTARNGQRYQLKEVVFFTTRDNGFIAQLAGGEELAIDETLSDLEKITAGLFIRVSRYFLVAIHRITQVVERFPETDEQLERDAMDECELVMDGSDIRPPVTSTYSKALKKGLGVPNLHHLVPEHPDDKRMRLLELIDFGWRELFELNADDPAAVNQSLMELGATLCALASPQCDGCPLRSPCVARRTGRARELPIKRTQSAKSVLFKSGVPCPPP